jgi:predicted MFS family arabinose efflux permease
VFFGVLAPMLPGLKHELALSTSAAGLLVAAYAVGSIIGALPAVALAARAGVRAAALVSLLALGLSSLLFGVGSVTAVLLAARLMQGIAGAVCFTAAMLWLLSVAPPTRRGALVGLAFGISEAGSIAGPLIGGAAATIGRGPAFVVLAAFCAGLAAATTLFSAPPRPAARRLELRPLLASQQIRTIVWVTIVPAIDLAAMMLLVPLELHRLGASVGVITATFGTAAVAGIMVRPLFGRWSDTRGPRFAVQAGLLASFPFVVIVPWLGNRFTLAGAAVISLVLIGAIWAPLLVILSDACLSAGVRQMMSVGVLNLAWPPGNAIGAAGGGAIAQAIGSRWSFAAAAAPLLIAYVAVSRLPGSLPS